MSPHDNTMRREPMPKLSEADLDAHLTEKLTPLDAFDVERESPWTYLLLAVAGVSAGAFGPIVFDWLAS